MRFIPRIYRDAKTMIGYTAKSAPWKHRVGHMKATNDLLKNMKMTFGHVSKAW